MAWGAFFAALDAHREDQKLQAEHDDLMTAAARIAAKG